jgi:hypothetical protein
MKTVKEIKAFVEAYGRICAYVPEKQVEHIVFMLCMGRDEEAIYKLYPEAVTVLDAYYIWSLALTMEYGDDNV